MISELALTGLIMTSTVCSATPQTPCEAALTVTLEAVTGVAKKRDIDRRHCWETQSKTAQALDASEEARQALAQANDPLPWVVAAGAAGVALGAVLTALLVK